MNLDLVMVTVRLTAKERERLNSQASENGMTLNDWCRVQLGLPTIASLRVATTVAVHDEGHE